MRFAGESACATNGKSFARKGGAGAFACQYRFLMTRASASGLPAWADTSELRSDAQGGALCHGYCGLAPPIDATPSMPPRPIVSTAVEGTTTIAPFSLMASYSIFMARRWSATGLCW
jgi:hypothetical protein